MSSAVSRELRELEKFLRAKGEIALFRVCGSKPREVHRNAPKKEDLGYQSVVGFADAVSGQDLVTPIKIKFVNEYRFSVSAAFVEPGLCPRVELEDFGEDPGVEH